jgi:ligand-binding SRPBCC domain-containing protein
VPCFEIESELAIPPERLWRHAVHPDGVNAELGPLLRMTFPHGTTDLTAGWSPGRRRFRSHVLLFGLLPVEYDDLAFESVEPGRGFLERSRMLTQSEWVHERRLRPIDSGTLLTDRIDFTPRLRWLAPISLVVFRSVFRHRHRRLRRLFAAGASGIPKSRAGPRGGAS